MTAFEELGMLPELGRAVDEMEWTLPTDIQSEAIPAILGGGDVLMAAETGSGKTGAFCLPVLQIVWESLRDSMLNKTHKPTNSIDERWCLNVHDRDNNLAIDPSGLLCQSRDPKAWNGTRCTHGVVGKGKFYYEGTITDDGLCRLGWSTANAVLDLGTDKNSFGYGGTGKKSYNKQFDNYGTSFTLGDIIGCMLDLDNGIIAFSKNGKHLGKAFDIPDTLRNAALYPAVVLKNAEIRFNFGETEFKHLFEGYIAVCKASPENTVISPNGSSANESKKIAEPNAPACIILEPTKELAEQTDGQLKTFKKYLKQPTIRNGLVIGSIPVNEQLGIIMSGIDIITCTPGRLEDFIQSGKILLSNVRFFILDEADSLVSAKNHLPTIERIHAALPKITALGERLQMIVCSATLHNFDVKKLADRMMHFPQWVDLKGQDSVPETVHHVVCKIDAKTDRMWIRLKPQERIQTDGIHTNDEIRPGSDYPETLSEGTKILKGEYVLKAIRQCNMDQGIIFCRTKLDCDNLERYLRRKAQDLTCVCLHGDRRPDERTRNLDAFKKGKAKFLICTDVAARGIDVKGIPFVINVTLPDEKANYLHRIGRVGRAERMGLAISLVSAHPEKVWYHKCPSRGVNCFNTALITQRGCAIWYDEPKLLEDIEEHLGVTVPQIDTDFIVPVDEFDGKVVYGAKRTNTGSLYEGHAVQLSGAVAQLADLERSLQLSYLRMFIASEKVK
ncbi:DEAD box ATP-dependent RNA helicase [Loa loa]|uniref:ATP-dependent RNA helicase n=1 Tax=Loa loa TaxID=7209 RepID=A0A1I7VS84_LOALO|nr:DEAD box ATP-dependent RNA helicase [Loa loa]EJD76225.1 DEAD box ATP-dependent RNA helicase [Loa loa]